MARMARKLKLMAVLRAQVGKIATNGATHTHDHGVHFQPDDGAKRVLITITSEGKFEPIQWYGMNTIAEDRGAHEASMVTAHAALIMSEVVLRLSLQQSGVTDGK